MVQRADAAEAQDRRDLCVFILEENELKSIYPIRLDLLQSIGAIDRSWRVYLVGCTYTLSDRIPCRMPGILWRMQVIPCRMHGIPCLMHSLFATDNIRCDPAIFLIEDDKWRRMKTFFPPYTKKNHQLY